MQINWDLLSFRGFALYIDFKKKILLSCCLSVFICFFSIAQNIGVNTDGSVPGTLFHTKNTVAGQNNYLRVENTQGGFQSAIQLLNSGTAGADWVWYIPGGTTEMRLKRASDLVTFLANGNVGIGTTIPGYKLETAGEARTTTTHYFGTNGASFDGTNQGGSLELGAGGATAGAGTPFIDFHYSGLTQDYNTRIINDANGRLNLIGTIRLNNLAGTGTRPVLVNASGDLTTGYLSGTSSNTHIQLQMSSNLTYYTVYEDNYVKLGVVRNGGVYQFAINPKAGSTGYWDYSREGGGGFVNAATAGTWYAWGADWGVDYTGGLTYFVNKESVLGFPTYRIGSHLHDTYGVGRRVSVVIEAWYP